MDEWQDIKTAPKDGSVVRVKLKKKKYVPGQECDAQYKTINTPFGRRTGWVILPNWNGPYEATHWKEPVD